MIGETIGPYKVEALLGRGGMGEVYRAHDERLDRSVALKILPTDLGGDRDRLGRFEREARLLAALQHQNIASIYGIEELNDQPVLVMELAEGDDLSQRLVAGPMDVDEVERMARQLSRGLEFAHEHGIVHRDLKPANIKVGGDGRIKIMDFGLARAYSAMPDGSGSSSPDTIMATVAQDLTRAGSVLGTPAYMSPEQARGYEVDRRADIWAFGVIIFEALTGKKLFAGETSSDTLAAVLRNEPDFSELPEETSPILVQLLRRCLQKDPQLRLRDVGEVRIALEDGSSSVFLSSSQAHSQLGLLPPVDRRQPMPWALAGVLTLLLVVALFMGLTGRLGPEPDPPPLVRSQIMLPVQTSLYLNPARPGPPVLSPDGLHLAYSALDSNGRVMLFVRELATEEPKVIAGTQDAVYPFWSPDSRSIAFFANETLNRVDLAGGPIVPICRAENGKGGSWSVDDIILFAPTHITSIHQVHASGGERTMVTSVETDSTARSHRFPCWLPDGKHFIYLAWHRGGGSQGNGNEAFLRVANLEGTDDRVLMPSQTNAIMAGGHLLYIHEGNLMGRPFSMAKAEFSGPQQPILGGVLALQAAHIGVFSATDSGILTYVEGGGLVGQTRLAWIDDQGNEVGSIPGMISAPQGLSISPDGGRVAISQADMRLGTFDIWVYEDGRNVGSRFTFDTESEISPVWSADGRRITYAANNRQVAGLFQKQANGSGEPSQLVQMIASVYPTCWSSDDRQLYFDVVDETGDFDMWILDLDEADTARVFRDTPFNEGQAALSPDGRWLAYTSNESGTFEVFIESLDDGGGRYRVSTDSGIHPRWAPDGETLYYLTATSTLTSTSCTVKNGGLVFGEAREIATGVGTAMLRPYDVHPTNGQLLLQVPIQDQVNSHVHLVTGWPALLSKDSP